VNSLVFHALAGASDRIDAHPHDSQDDDNSKLTLEKLQKLGLERMTNPSTHTWRIMRLR
jgi:hypothetical protein